MANIYTLKVTEMVCAPQASGETDVVINVGWAYLGTDGTNTGSFGGTTALTYTEGSPFTPYADLTQEQVSGWVLSAWTADQTASYQSQLDSQLAVTSPPLPWPAVESVAVAPVAA